VKPRYIDATCTLAVSVAATGTSIVVVDIVACHRAAITTAADGCTLVIPVVRIVLAFCV